MKRYIDYLIRSEEHRVDEMLFLQIKDKNDSCYGLMRGDVIEAKPTIYMMATALALYLNSRSRYYKSEKLMEARQMVWHVFREKAAILIIRAVISSQHQIQAFAIKD